MLDRYIINKKGYIRKWKVTKRCRVASLKKKKRKEMGIVSKHQLRKDPSKYPNAYIK
jgi:hypothetical protein